MINYGIHIYYQLSSSAFFFINTTLKELANKKASISSLLSSLSYHKMCSPKSNKDPIKKGVETEGNWVTVKLKEQ